MGLKYTSASGRVTIYEPRPPNVYYILRWKTAGLPKTTRAGRTLEGAFKKAAEIERKLSLANSAAASAKYFNDLLDGYVDPERKKEDATSANRQWTTGYTEKVDYWVTKSREALGEARLTNLDQASLSDLVNKENTYSQAVQFRATLHAICAFGVRVGYLRPDQGFIADFEITVPVGARTRTPPIPAQGESSYLIDDSAVPTNDAVASLAGQDIGYPHWAGIVNTLAYAGPRIHECLALTAFDVVELVDKDGIKFTALRIERQVIEPKRGGIRMSAPKNGKKRYAVAVERTPAGFELAGWLRERADTARAEQDAGKNRLALLFPSPRGKYWRLRNFRKRCWDRACESAGWKATTIRANATWKTRQGQVTNAVAHRLWAHPIHSLRHRFACTARDDWEWNGRELCMAGGWASEDFVAKRYYKFTSKVLASAAQKQRGRPPGQQVVTANGIAPWTEAEETA